MKRLFTWRTVAIIEIIVIWYLVSIMPDYTALFNL